MRRQYVAPSPGVRLVPSSDFRLTDQLYADDLVVLGESEADLQLALDAVTRWGRQWRFSFGVGPEKSAVMIFGPARSRPSCRVCLSGQPLPVVSSYRYLGVVLTPSLRWDAHVAHLVSRGHRLFAQCVSWARSEGLSVSFAHFLLATYVFPSAMYGTEFVGDCARSLAQLDLLKDVGDDIFSVGPQGPRAPQFCMSLLCRTASALQRADPCPFSAVCTPFHQEDALPSQRQCSSSLNISQELGPTGVFSLLHHHGVGSPGYHGVGVGCSPLVIRRWLHHVVFPVLDRAWVQRLARALAILTGVRFSPGSVRPFALDLSIYNSDVDPGLFRWWGLARHGHDPCPGGRPARHRGGEVACLFCPSTFGDLTHCLTSCPAFEDVRVQWCIAVHIAPAEVSTSAQHSWVFDPTHPANTRSTVRAHVRFVGQVCARVFERSTLPS